MATVFSVDRYQYYQFAARDDLKAVAILYGVGGETCYVWFEARDGELEPATNFSGNQYRFHYHYKDMASLIDMLRNEKPVYVIYQPAGANNSRISTGSEPVGEGEQ